MQFQVPQFIEVEDKIFGPLTGRQFVYLAGGAGIVFVIWTLLPTFLAVIVVVPIAGLALALSFYKINNRPFIFVLESAFNYLTKNKLYIWQKRDRKPKAKAIDTERKESLIQVPKLSQSKLKDLAWSLDIKESMYTDPAQRGTIAPEKHDFKLKI